MEKQIYKILDEFNEGQIRLSVAYNRIINIVTANQIKIEKNKTVLKDLFNECKNVDEFINVVAENFELK